MSTIHRWIADQCAQVGGGGETELAADRGELVRAWRKTTTSARWA